VEAADVGEQSEPRRATRASGRHGRRGKQRKGSFWRELPILIVVALLLALMIKTFLAQAFYIPSESMERTLMVGDRVLVNKLTPWFGAKPQRGQVVVFRDRLNWLQPAPAANSGNPVSRGIKDVFTFIGLLPSNNDQDLIKRVIGVGGDEVKCENNRVIVNNVPLTEPYLFPGAIPCDKPLDVKVPPNRLWVMGDNRGDSADSRVHMDEPGQGTISEDAVVGRAFVVIWPLNRMHTLPVPDTFHQHGLAAGATRAAGAIAGDPPLVLGAAAALPLVALTRPGRRRLAGRLRPGGHRE
jgi:signal peptidase I